MSSIVAKARLRMAVVEGMLQLAQPAIPCIAPQGREGC